MTLLRTATDGCFELTTNAWGSFLSSVPDPDANVEVTDEQFQGFELREGITKLPADLWQRWVQLAFALAERDRRNLEVSCRLLRHEDDRSRWRILVPKQAVSSASVRVDSFDQAVDIETGEIISQYPPAGWIPCGSSHSHNSMAAFFSGTDDKYELGDPGLHVVIGTIDTINLKYTLKASVTANHRRFDIGFADVIDTAPADTTYHPSAIEMVSIETFKAPVFQAGKLQKTNTSMTKWYNDDSDDYTDYGSYLSDHDPFYWRSQSSTSVSQDERDLDTLLDELTDLLTHLADGLSQCQSASIAHRLDELNWQLNDLSTDYVRVTTNSHV